ncbi:TlpA disulfide reductase family protein [Pedobacter frigoris]|uniref:TlpA disulfide reductase family protein n=1 Tax=Pedobacter frigoris TaxID=2571272 RepID=UPI00292E0341|nr:TlpA disulfide reductase family protein [Pedobacter frigoris]
MKKLLTGLCLVILTLAAQAQIKKVTIQGDIKGLGDQELILLNVDQSTIAKVNAIAGSFKIAADMEIGDMRHYYLYAPSLGKLGPSMNNPTISFFACSQKIEIQAAVKGKDMKIITVKGSPCGDVYHKLYDNLSANKELDIAAKPYNEAFHLYNNVEKSPENLEKLKKAGKRIDELYREQREQILNLIPKHRNSMPVAVMASLYAEPGDSIPKIEAFLKQFDPSIQHCYYLQQIKRKLDRIKAVAIGQQAPGFELKNLDGAPVNLNAFKGKYLLLDFWASWCGPCRKENPTVVKAYDNYKAKGFTVLGVSLDADEAAWRKAVKEDGLPWTQVLNDKQVGAQRLYDVKAIPANFLIDPQGKIIATNLRGPELEQALEKFIK